MRRAIASSSTPNAVPGRRRAFAQLQHQLAHAVQRVLDRHQHVLLELRVVVQPLGVLHHQRQLRHDVLQVVHDEGRHAVEGLELAHLEQGLGGLHLGQEAGGLAAGGLEQVVDLPVDVHRRPRTAQHDEADQFCSPTISGTTSQACGVSCSQAGSTSGRSAAGRSGTPRG
jgi:hypothetical protein